MRCVTISGIGWILPGREGHVGGTAADNRLFVEAVCQISRGSLGAICPRALATGRSSISASTGGRAAFSSEFRLLASDHDNEYMMIDATIVRAHQLRGRPKKHGAQAIGRSRGGLTTKIHALVDALGNPVEVMLSPGQDHDLTCAQPLIEAVDPGALIADKAFDADAFIAALNDRAIVPSSIQIQPKTPRPALRPLRNATRELQQAQASAIATLHKLAKIPRRRPPRLRRHPPQRPTTRVLVRV